MIPTLRSLFAQRAKPTPLLPAMVSPERELMGTEPGWANPKYGEYYATSVPIYAAIKMRAEAVSRVPLRVHTGTGEEMKPAPDHPLQTLLDRVNGWWTRGDLWRATETYLGLWGSAFWVLTKAGPNSTPTEIFIARTDQMRVIPSREKYIQGFEYRPFGRTVALRPDEVVWLRYFNPLDEFAGLSPVAALRLSADMGKNALSFNANVFKKGMLIGSLAIESDTTPTDQEVADFQRRLQARFSGPENAHLPIIMSAGMQVKNLGFSMREMEYIQSLRWSLEDVARAYNVPKVLLHDLERATYSNYAQAELMFWRSAIVPQLVFLEEEINEMLAPEFGDGVSVKFDLSVVEALQEDEDRKHARLREDVKTGLVTINEARRQLHLEAQPWGDSWWVPFGVVPVEEASPALEGGRSVTRGLFKPYKEGDLLRLDAVFQKRLDSNERRLLRTVRALFAQQRKETLERAHQMLSGLVSKQLGPKILNPDEWDALFEREMKPALTAVLVQAAKEAAAEFRLGPFDVFNPLVQKAIHERVVFWAKRVNEETSRLLSSELSAGLAAGEGIPQLLERVEKVFGFAESWRAERIARTEAHWGSNKGAIESYRQSGLVQEKMWLSARDNRVRDAHREADGQTVPFESPFVVAGETLMFPGDGSPINSVNCRCAAVPILGGQKALRADGHQPDMGTVVKAALEGERKTTEEKLSGLAKGLEEATRKRITRVRKKVTVDEHGFPAEVEETHEEL